MRITGRIISALLAMALAVGGVLVALEVLVARLGRHYLVLDHPRWDHYVRANTWAAPSFRWLMVLMVIGGVVLVALGLAHRRPLQVETVGMGTPTRIAIQRSSLESALGDDAGRVDGVSEARVRVDKGIAKVSARSNRRDVGGLDRAVTQRVEQRLADWGLAGRVQVRARVTAREK
ncbi:MAG: hypothetical protein NVS3B21_07620 [Acidimicrobiales bacterium]